MIQADLLYVKRLLEEKVISEPVLELGAGYGGNTCRSLIEAADLAYFGTDLNSAPNVDFVVDFEDQNQLQTFSKVAPFGSILILNVLEHTFDPIRILDNAISLLRTGGSLIVLTPSVWPLHNYPMDAWRILPNFYEEYAKRRGLELLPSYFEYVGFGSVATYRAPDNSYSFPPPHPTGFRQIYSRAIHKAFNTFGRGMLQPSHFAVAAALRRI